VFVSPTEPPALKAIGRVGLLPERFGVDVLWTAHGSKYGAQRKTVADLLASVEDGRLSKELAQMKSSSIHAFLIIEGRVRWTDDGELMGNAWGRQWTRSHWWGLLMSVQEQGVGWFETRDVGETADCVRAIEAWSKKKTHGSGRPGPKGIWGTSPTDRDWGVHVLTSFPGIGPEIAGRVFDRGGRVPLEWTITMEELMATEGIGKKRAAAMIKALRGE
jgi:DNA excision repair protein ERCC-4